jgi:hypothetical protein
MNMIPAMDVLSFMIFKPRADRIRARNIPLPRSIAAPRFIAAAVAIGRCYGAACEKRERLRCDRTSPIS